MEAFLFYGCALVQSAVVLEVRAIVFADYFSFGSGFIRFIPSTADCPQRREICFRGVHQGYNTEAGDDVYYRLDSI